MKNILNVNKISLKPIFMSLAILCAAGVIVPHSFEKSVEASSSSSDYDLWPDGGPFSSDDDNKPLKFPYNLEQYGIDPEEYNIPEIPPFNNGQPLKDVRANKTHNGKLLLYPVYGDKNDHSYGAMDFAKPNSGDTFTPKNNNLDDIGPLDGNSREQSLWQKCCPCCFKNYNKKND